MTGSHEPRFDELLPAYVLGSLEGDDLAVLESHLRAGCGRCEEQLAAWQGDLESLANSVVPVRPSPEVRRRVLGAVARRRRRRDPARWLALAASLAALAAAGGVGLQQAGLRDRLGRLSAESDQLHRELTAARDEIREARGQVGRLASAVGILAAPATRTVTLAGLPAAPGARGSALVQAQAHRAVFHAYGLPPAPRGKTYQLWLIAGGRPISAGTFAVDDRGDGELEVADLPPAEGIEAWAVTIEPAGGVPTPTGVMVLKS